MDGLNITIIGALGALAGGFFGAALGGLFVFVFTGIAVLVGIAIVIAGGDANFLGMIGFGQYFGPHIAFGGGVAAVAYAAQRGWIATGRDIVTPLAGLGKPCVLLVGAVFGLLAYLIQSLLAAFPSIGGNTDSVALTVVISGLIVRLVFGKTGIVGAHEDGHTGAAKFAPGGNHAWIAFQDSFAMTTIIGLFVGLLAAWASVELLKLYPGSPVFLLGFALSTMSIGFLGLQMSVPATHHITLISGVTVAQFTGIITSDVMLVLTGAFAGMLAAIVAQLFARFWHIRGDTHIDPPASAIWPMTTVAILLAGLFR